MEKVQLISITPEELIQPIFDYIDQKFDELEKSYQQKKTTKYITRQEVAKMLSIKATSVYNWTNKKILQSYRIGGRVLYKRSEIEKSIIKINH